MDRKVIIGAKLEGDTGSVLQFSCKATSLEFQNRIDLQNVFTKESG